jgi:hypothetical protein
MRLDATILLWALPLLLAAGCRRSATPGDRRESRQHLVADKRFAGDARVAVWEIPGQRSLVFPGSEISGEEPPEQARLRAAWVGRSALHSRVLLHPRRLVWILPPRVLPGGEADVLHLVLKPESNIAALVSHKRKVYWADSPAQLAAWVEGCLKPGPAVQRIELLAQSAEGPHTPSGGPDVAHTVHRLQGLLVPRAEGSATGAKLRYNLRTRAVEASTYGGPTQGQSLLWDLALLPFVTVTSAKALAPLRARQRWPRQVDLRPARTGPGGPSGAPWLRLSFRLGERKRRQVASHLLRLPPGPGYRRMFGPLTFSKGHQLQRRPVPRAYKRRRGDPRKPHLELTNRGPRVAYVYADGVLLGWVGPRQATLLSTGESGYYRITARSLFGTTLWGPRDLYVPGAVRLGP